MRIYVSSMHTVAHDSLHLPLSVSLIYRSYTRALLVSPNIRHLFVTEQSDDLFRYVFN